VKTFDVLGETHGKGHAKTLTEYEEKHDVHPISG
jgi:hypothetical protein